ncbi:CsiV family protein [Kangiella koreensis]|uniref:Peptidoglycan-binding LysM n=1 Tax=Kangiella koreensis (strain DSM 16069 / JCM 12317 / KCTC 12182 / SW-125) TaxID=523791 RepID=C7RBB5_KANKD|nr:CsiV family protein [Kangiella koreensis]ACV26557.1 hypothetical protein Kkor_1138 [Kangiella koreensis DSM 16069]
MSKRIIILAACLMLAFSTNSALAQSVFDVEFIVFKRIDQQDNAAQVKETNLPELNDEISLNELPEGYSQLLASQFKLEGVYNRLRTSPNIRPLLHFGWRQPLMDKADTPWLHYNLSDEAETEGLEQFEGVIRFSRNQGLLVEHKVIGFKPMRIPQQFLSSEPQNSSNENSDEDMNAIFVDAEALNDQIVVDQQMPDQLHGYFVLSENRKVKLDELHYFDHPNMGILLKVTPHKASLEEQEALENP